MTYDYFLKKVKARCQPPISTYLAYHRYFSVEMSYE